MAGVCWAGWRLDRGTPVLAGTLASISIDQPDGVGDTVGEGDDFATTVLGDPWDMSEHTDVMAYHDLPNPVFSDGKLHFTLDPGDTRATVRVLFPGSEGRIDVGKIGMNYPISAGHYHWLSFSMYHPGGTFRIKWYYDRYANPSRKYVTSSPVTVTPGWYTYVIDLDEIDIFETSGGGIDWRGQVRELDIIPIASPGDEIIIDWVRLTADNPAGNGLDIVWSGLDQVGSDVYFYLDPDTSGCDGPLIHTESNAQESGSFTWQQASYTWGANGLPSPANVAPGDYYVCAKVGGDIFYSSGPLTVGQAPIVRFTQPSFTSGPDYATDAGNPWDMADSADVKEVVNGSHTFTGGKLKVTVPSSKVDVQVHMALPVSPIDSGRYYYLTYRLRFANDYELRTDVGQQTRVFWGRKPKTETTSGLIYVFPGWQTYTVDLRTLPLYSGPTWGTADWSIFRIDPIANYTGGTATFYMDYMMLTGDEEADNDIDVTWQMTDPDSSVTTMTLFYDGDQTGLDGTHIVTLTLTNGMNMGGAVVGGEASPSLSATGGLTYTVYLPLMLKNWRQPCSGACYTWFTGDMPDGAYYLYACMDDGYNQLCRYSETPVYISHP